MCSQSCGLKTSNSLSPWNLLELGTLTILTSTDWGPLEAEPAASTVLNPGDFVGWLVSRTTLQYSFDVSLPVIFFSGNVQNYYLTLVPNIPYCHRESQL